MKNGSFVLNAKRDMNVSPPNTVANPPVGILSKST
jgi:hypothetical protein